MKTLGSDTMAPAFPEVLEALARANSGEEPSYGSDSHTKRVSDFLCGLLDTEVVVRWTLGGTGANVLAMALAVQRHEGIVLSDVAHMVEHECGAPVQATGAQFMTLPSVDGRISLDAARTLIQKYQHPHCSQPKVLSLTQATEVGTVYSVEQIKQFADLAHEFDMYLHIDGARIANALVALDVSAKELITDAGVDIASFGATKAGTMLGEAVVALNPQLHEDVHSMHVATGQLTAKARFIAAQYEAYFADDRWLRGARNANAMAQLLAKQVAEIDGIDTRPVEANMVFAEVSNEIAKQFEGQMYEIGTNIMRWVPAWDTTVDDINELCDTLRKASAK